MIGRSGEKEAMKRKIIYVLFTACLCATSMLAQNPQQLSWNILQDGLNNKNSQQRVSAVSVLGLITSDPRGVEMAEQALKDQNPDVREAAATALGTQKSQRSIPALQLALKDSSPAVIMAAAKSLVAMNNEDGYDIYYAVATGNMKSGQGLVGSQESKLNQLLHNPKDMAETAFEQGIGFVPFGGISYGAFKVIHDNGQNAIVVKATAIKMLAKDRDPRSGKALIAATSDDQWVIRSAAYDALARWGDRSLLPQMAMGLTDQNEVVKLTAAAAIAQLSALR
jgi:HEAT repeat protein